MESTTTTIKDFTRFQVHVVTTTPKAKCIIPSHAAGSCYPQFTDKACHTCAINWIKENQDK